MFAAMLGAISATDRPTAAHTDSERLSPGFPGALDIGASMCSSSTLLRPLSLPPCPPVRKRQKDAKQRCNQLFPPAPARHPAPWPGKGIGVPLTPHCVFPESLSEPFCPLA